MNGNKSVTANFSEVTGYTLNLSKNGNGRVRVNGVERTLPWSGEFDCNAQVQLEALPDDCWEFSSWSGALSGISSAPATIFTPIRPGTQTFPGTIHYLATG